MLVFRKVDLWLMIYGPLKILREVVRIVFYIYHRLWLIIVFLSIKKKQKKTNSQNVEAMLNDDPL